jgi:serine/threonine protein kinase
MFTANSMYKVSNDVENYGEILKSHGWSPNIVDYYCQVGTVEEKLGWLIHISSVISQLGQLFEAIFPVLRKFEVPFKIPRNKETARVILSGNAGLTKIGKIVTIYPTDNLLASIIAEELVRITSEFRGPIISTDIHLGGCVYTRFGGFKHIIGQDIHGNLVKLVKNNGGKLIVDEYPIPCPVPEAGWPFTFCAPMPYDIDANIHDRIQLARLLKTHPKGDVFEGTFLLQDGVRKDCVIKQGISNMWSDDLGRDMIDRLKWQKEILSDLANVLPVPKVYDLLIRNDGAYLVMEKIHGPSLRRYIESLNKNYGAWPFLDTRTKISIVEHLTELSILIGQLHSKGYVHRDLTPENFLVNDQGKIVFIDLEMCYSIKLGLQSLPFQFGTAGFAAPEQVRSDTPTFSEDIYGLGATFFFLMSGLSPLKLEQSNPIRLKKAVQFIVRFQPVVRLITKCLDPDPFERPKIKEVIEILEDYKMALIRGEVGENMIFERPVAEDIDTCIESAIRGLTGSYTAARNGIWLTRDSNTNLSGPAVLKVLPGLANGLAGVLYTLAQAKIFGYKIESCTEQIEASWKLIFNTVIARLPNVPPGLYAGSAGISIMMGEMMRSGLLPMSKENIELLKACIRTDMDDVTIANGLAGQGIALIRNRQFYNLDEFTAILSQIIDKIFSVQIEGSWMDLVNSEGGKWYSLSLAYGNSGVLYCISEALHYLKDQTLTEKFKECYEVFQFQLPTLISSLRQEGALLFNDQPFMNECFQGATLTTLSAYRRTGHESIKTQFYDLIQWLSKNVLYNNWGNDIGLAALGELFLEAGQVFNDKTFVERAFWIGCVLVSMKKLDTSENIWTITDELLMTADFQYGTAGVIHFLLKLRHPTDVRCKLF